MKRLSILPDFQYSSRSGEAIINYIHRKIDGSEVYFIANRKRNAEEVLATFRVSGKRPELWDPSTGTRLPLAMFDQDNGRTSVPLQLDPAGSCFVVFRSPIKETYIKALEKSGSALISSNSAFPALRSGRFADVTANFTITAWAKPETDDILDGKFVGKDISSYLFYPPEGEVL
jgi:hypothetical protein